VVERLLLLPDFSPDIFNQTLILLEDKCIAMNGKTLSELGL
jgi:hypothetical protein